MLGHRELTMQDYMGILKRRFWLILVSTIALLGIGIGITYIIPPEYVSQTLVLIEQQKVPEDYVKPVVNEDLNGRLASMKEQILSRSRLQPIIERYNLYPGNNYTLDDRIALTQKAIGVKPIPAGQASHGIPGFFITFKARDARTAQQVCTEITSLFVSENLTARQESAEGTTSFLKQQLADSKTNLDEQDAKLAAFERKYLGKLPEQEASNTNTLQALTTQLDASTQVVSRMQQDETFLETMIAQHPPETVHTDPVTGVTDENLNTQLKEALTQQEELEALYTPDHPDVVAIRRKVANLRAEIAHSSETPAKTTAATVVHNDSPQLQQLKAQLRAAQQSLAGAKQEQARIQKQIGTYEARIESSPMVEEEYKQVTRDHETALQFYNTLLTKMNESSMATALEHRQQGEQFSIMDAANLPDSPTFPNRLMFAGGGFAAGLALGLALAAFFEYRDTSLRDENDIWAFTKLPTLAIISHVDDLTKLAKKSKRQKLISRADKPIESVGS
ncbi:MAG: Wzz/FepE/Etk N-terminal domain-containing protein [Terracidiphilus sp.]|jgi:polysaccharide chain length determinant protein (PEP-CTERM system associated)